MKRHRVVFGDQSQMTEVTERAGPTHAPNLTVVIAARGPAGYAAIE